jgi:hypothetical protein
MKKIVIYIFLILFISVQIPAQEAIYQKSVLALYKSSENQTKEENEIYFYMSRTLTELGLDIVYWDIDRGIPGDSVTRYSRAVISWFRGPSMRNPEAYLDFIDNMINQGKKVLIMDNFGAYQDRQTEEFVHPLRINTTFAKLGIMYYGDWTQDGSILEIDKKDSVMVEDQGKQNVQTSAFFYHFISSDRELKTYLSIKRTDREYDSSPVIVSNKNGGFALSRYIYRVENGAVKLLLNMKEFLRESLFPDTGKQKLAILVNLSITDADDILRYTESVLGRAKIDYDIIKPISFRGMVPNDLRPYSAVGLILDADSGLDPAIFDQYLNDGGNIVSLRTGHFNQLAPYLGIKETTSLVRDSTGYRIKNGFFTGENVSIDQNEFRWTPGGAIPVDNAQILATSFNQRVPLMWKTRVNRGNVITWNWDEFKYGEYMGFILESFLYVQPVGIAATPGISLFYLDDWPIPMYNTVKNPMTIIDTDFYTETWWPEINELLGKWNQPFSSYLVFNYNVTTEPPFETGEFFVAKNNGSLKIANDHFKNNIELGLHGYNHMSLTSKKTDLTPFVWNDSENMNLAVAQARADWIRLFGEQNLPRTYVAPHNIISKEGIEALQTYFPTIKAICTLHTGDDEEEAYEFGYNKDFPQVYMLPRITSGYNFSEETKKNIISGVVGPGLWSHFIHADDVYDPHRSQGKNWPEIKEELNSMISFVRTNYPWLRPMNVYDGYRAMSEYDSQAVEIYVDGNKVHVSTNSPGVMFRVRFEGKRIKKVTNGTILYSYKAVDEVVIRADAREIDIELQ